MSAKGCSTREHILAASASMLAFAFSTFFGYHDAAINESRQKSRMHLQQTKSESRASGGPQYYFHTVPPAIKDFLRQRGACPVILETPYGIATSSFLAVGRGHKLTGTGQIIAGSVGHDRIQQGSRQDSIGAAIRHWYAIKTTADFERIDVEVRIHTEGHFIL